MGRFSSGASGSALTQFGHEDRNFKRPRGVQPSMPGYGPRRRHEHVRAGAALGGKSVRRVLVGSGRHDVELDELLPVQARLWSASCAVGEFNQGALLFVRKDQQHAVYKSVADLATANWILRHARDSLYSMDATANHGSGSNAHKTHGWKGEQGWNYMGSLRNKYKAPTSLLTLMNVDCFGRSRVANIYGTKIKSGDRVGIALVPVNIANYPFLAGPGGGSHNTTQYIESLKKDGKADDKNKTWSAGELIMGKRKPVLDEQGNSIVSDDGEQIVGDYGRNAYTVWQWLPTLNGKLADYVTTRLFDNNEIPDFIDHVSVSCVSNAPLRSEHRIGHVRGLLSSDAYTTLPQLEVLVG